MALSTICPRRGDLYSFTTVNPVLAVGELAIEYPDSGVGTGLCKFKIGDGKTKYADLPYAFDANAANSINGGNAESSHVIQIRSDTSFNWQTINPILEVGEMGFDSDQYSIKVGDGKTKWNDLPFIKSSSDLMDEIDCGFEG